MTKSQRPTPPVDCGELARDTERHLRAIAPLPELVHLSPPAIAGTLVPRIAVSMYELRQFPLDHRAGFVVSLIDDRVDVETLADMSGMPRDEVVAILDELVARGVVAVR